VTAPAYPNLHRIAYGEGARLTAEARVEAADALERLARRCDGCKFYVAYHSTILPHGSCELAQSASDQPMVLDDDAECGRLLVDADHACNAWQPIPLTPAHDKEKS